MKQSQLLLSVPSVAFGVTLGLTAKKALHTGIEQALQAWRSDPKSQAVNLGISLAYGQGVMWTIGQDFIGVGMNPRWRPGIGHKLAPLIARRLPFTPLVTWTVKAIEIASDATKIPIEGRLYRRVGIVPDVVAQAVTQPLWSYIEVVEKLIGIVHYPERVTTPEQLEDSISSIYGTWTRNLAGLILWRYGSGWSRQLRIRLGK